MARELLYCGSLTGAVLRSGDGQEHPPECEAGHPACVLRATLHAVLDVLEEPLVVVDESGVIVFGNALGHQMLRERLPSARRKTVECVTPAGRRSFELWRWGPTQRSARAESRPMTGRQMNVLALLLRGLSNKEIASELGCAENTIEYHVTRLLRRHGVDSRAKLAARVLGL